MAVKDVVIGVVMFPFFVIFMFIFMAVWFVLTITGIGPILQNCYKQKDKRTLDREKFAANNSNMKVLTIPGDVNSCSMGDSYKIFAIYSEPETPSKYPPVCIPNGLGATAVLICQMQEALVECGFTVLSFDRLGVGMSDENTSKKSPTGQDLVKEMEYVMSHFRDKNDKWILLGPSMGSIVAQCYISRYPHKVVGFLNMDGLPYPFITQKSMFMWAGFIYKIYASIIWTGALRPFIGVALKSSEKMFKCKSFPLSVVVAQMNQAQFFSNVGLEMATMMDCCVMAEEAWGTFSVLKMDRADLEALIRATPNICIEFDPISDERRETTFRSISELGGGWVDTESTQAALNHLRRMSVSVMENGGNKDCSTITTITAIGGSGSIANNNGSDDSNSLLTPLTTDDRLSTLIPYNYNGTGEPSVLGRKWASLVVRVMSARDHDFGNPLANSFYNQEMRDLAAAEHAVHALLARDGYRTVYPKVSHTVMFSKTEDIVKNILEIGDALEKIKEGN